MGHLDYQDRMTSLAPRWVLLLSLAFGGCAGLNDASKAEVPDGGGKDSGANDQLSFSYDPTQPEPGETITVKVYPTDGNVLIDSYSWSVAGQTQAGTVKHTASSTGSQITFQPKVSDTYLVTCEAKVAGSLDLTGTVKISVEYSSKMRVYTIKAVPPASKKLASTSTPVNVGELDKSDVAVELQAGSEVTVEVLSPEGDALPAYLRLFTKASDPMPLDFYIPAGTGKIQVDTGKLYHLLTYPTVAKVPAFLEPSLSSSGGSTWKVQLSDPVKVTGTVRLEGAVMTGAKVALYTKDKTSSIDVPSSVATTGSSGQFQIMARSGEGINFIVSPPPEMNLPTATIAETQLKISADTADWNFNYTKLAQVKVFGSVARSDGQPAVGAKVALTYQGSAIAGVLDTPSGSFNGVATYKKTLTTDENGDLASESTDLKLPQGTYKVEVWPGSSDQDGQSYRILTRSFTSDEFDLSLSLEPKAKITGLVKSPDGDPTAAVIQASGSSGIYSARSDSKGTFTILLDPGVPFTLSARNLSTGEGTGIYKTSRTFGSKAEFLEIVLPKARIVSGRVKYQQNNLPNVHLSIWCSDTKCSSSDVLDEFWSLPDGSFELKVPAE
jgi:hypothetical protein